MSLFIHWVLWRMRGVGDTGKNHMILGVWPLTEGISHVWRLCDFSSPVWQVTHSKVPPGLCSQSPHGSGCSSCPTSSSYPAFYLVLSVVTSPPWSFPHPSENWALAPCAPLNSESTVSWGRGSMGSRLRRWAQRQSNHQSANPGSSPS